MKPYDFDSAQSYVLGRLERELAPDLYYHGIHHTRDDVLPAAERLARLEQLGPEETLVVRTAALFHDFGYVETYYRNESVGVRLAAGSLPHFGYTPAQIADVGRIIMATQLPQRPQGLLEKIMCDADLDSLGRKDFFITSHRLRLEMAAYDVPVPLLEWYPRQLDFLEGHQYFTDAARLLRDDGKRNNILEIRRLLRLDGHS